MFLILLLTLLLTQEPKTIPEPKIIGTMLCTKIGPPPADAKPNTTTLSCMRQRPLTTEDAQPQVYEVPEWLATFRGKVFVRTLLDNGTAYFDPKKQPEGSVIEFAPACPKKEKGYDAMRAALNPAPCNPELTPQ